MHAQLRPRKRKKSSRQSKKRSSLTIAAFVVSCWAQQLFELIQQFEIIEKFRESEAVLAQFGSRKYKKKREALLFLHLLFLVVLNNCCNWVNIIGHSIWDNRGFRGRHRRSLSRWAFGLHRVYCRRPWGGSFFQGSLWWGWASGWLRTWGCCKKGYW